MREDVKASKMLSLRWMFLHVYLEHAKDDCKGTYAPQHKKHLKPEAANYNYSVSFRYGS